MERIEVQADGGAYPVWVGVGILEGMGELLVSSGMVAGRRCFLVSDEGVGGLYGEAVRGVLERGGFEVLGWSYVPQGEGSKSWERAGEVAEAVIAAGLDRGDFVVALGGGVVGDLAGFVAGVVFRGVDCVQVPTSVVAQVDSAVGGKTGVNSRLGKNLLGVFHAPRVVVADVRTLRTLPEREFREGLAEAVKHAVIADAAMLEALERCERAEEGALAALVARNVRIKAAVVQEDERERTGRRALLNFGHTVGHAIEAAAGYGRWLHGEAVSLGMVAALRLSRRFAGLSAEEEGRVVGLLRGLGLPVDLRLAPRGEELVEAMRRDKKFERGQVRFVLTPRLGEAFVSKEVGLGAIGEVIEELRAEGSGG